MFASSSQKRKTDKQKLWSVVFADSRVSVLPPGSGVSSWYVTTERGLGGGVYSWFLEASMNWLQHSTGCGVKSVLAKAMKEHLSEDVASEQRLGLQQAIP